MLFDMPSAAALATGTAQTASPFFSDFLPLIYLTVAFVAFLGLFAVMLIKI